MATLYVNYNCTFVSVFELVTNCHVVIYPVMLMGALVYGIKYSIPEYICTFLVAGGVSTFALLKVCASSSYVAKNAFLCRLCLSLPQ